MKFVLPLLLALLVNPVFAESLTGKVVGVSDGDTITMLSHHHDAVDKTNAKAHSGRCRHVAEKAARRSSIADIPASAVSA